jgi:hypothetical protein
MSIYSIGRRTTNVTGGQVNFDVACGSGVTARLMELGIFLAAATAGTYGLNRPTALGTRTSPVALLLESEPGVLPAAETDSAIAHSVQPTLATDYFRRISFPATIGTGVIWTFPRGVAMALSTSLAVVGITTPAVCDVHAAVDE